MNPTLKKRDILFSQIDLQNDLVLQLLALGFTAEAAYPVRKRILKEGGTAELHDTIMSLYRPPDDNIWIPLKLRVIKLSQSQVSETSSQPIHDQVATSKFLLKIDTSPEIDPRFNLSGYFQLDHIESVVTDHLGGIKTELDFIQSQLIALIDKILQETLDRVKKELPL